VWLSGVGACEVLVWLRRPAPAPSVPLVRPLPGLRST